MDPLLALLLVAAAAALAASGWHACSRIPDVLGGLFRAPDLGWPRGVQEEEPVAWNWTAVPLEADDELVDIVARPGRIAPRMSRGLARRGRW